MSVNCATVEPELLRWACARAGCDIGALPHCIPRLQEWEHGELQRTVKQIKEFAKATTAR